MNFISPCDGRGDNLFVILYKRLIGTYNATYPPQPFHFIIKDVSKRDDQYISLSASVSSISAIACIVNISKSDPTQMIYEEKPEFRYYVRTNQMSSLKFRVQYTSDYEQQLYCRISGLLYDPYHVEYYTSPPFNVTYDDIIIENLKTSKKAAIFTYVPKNIEWKQNESISRKDHLIACKESVFEKFYSFTQLNGNNTLFYSTHSLPVTVYAMARTPYVDTIYCGWFEKISKESWKLVHTDPIALKH